MKRILSLVLASLMLLSIVSCKDAAEETVAKQVAPEEVSGFFEEVTFSQNENTEPSVPGNPTDPPELELPNEGNDIEMTQQDALAGFSIKEKRFTYEYKDYILFDITNETDTNYNLTVHAKYFDAEGKKLDETWEVYSDFAAGHQQYILLDPGKKFAECKYDFQLKETESDCWRSKVTVEPAEMYVFSGTKMTEPSLSVDFNVKNETDKTVYVSFKGILIFDSEGEIYLIKDHGRVRRESWDEGHMGCQVVKAPTKEELVVPEELKDGYTAIAVIESITEE